MVAFSFVALSFGLSAAVLRLFLVLFFLLGHWTNLVTFCKLHATCRSVSVFVVRVLFSCLFVFLFFFVLLFCVGRTLIERLLLSQINS